GAEAFGHGRVVEVFEDQLGIADDAVDLVEQLVAQDPDLRARAHDGPPGRSAAIFSRSRGRSTGLVSKSSQPASKARTRSPAMAWAVSAGPGLPLVPGAAFSCRVASRPAIH